METLDFMVRDGNLPTDWNVHRPHTVRAMGKPEREGGYKIPLSGVSFTTPWRGSVDSVLLFCLGRTSDTSLDKD